MRVSIQEKQDPTKLHSHESEELVCVYDGEGMHLTEAGRTPLRQGDVFVIPRGFSAGIWSRRNSLFSMCFSCRSVCNTAQLDLCRMAGFQELFMPLNARNTYPFFHISGEGLSEIMPLLKELLAESRNFAPACRTCRLRLLMVLLCKLTRLYCVCKKVR
ncbi:MAG: cupin domain-containing protein, partial [Victivallales bacterium]